MRFLRFGKWARPLFPNLLINFPKESRLFSTFRHMSAKMLAIVLISAAHNPEENLTLTDRTFVRNEEYEIANDFDLRAVESAVSLKELGFVDRVVAFSASERTTHITKALAMGADEALWACANDADLSPQIVVQTVIEAVSRRYPDDFSQAIWMLGKLGVNYESHQTAQRLAAQLGVPCLCSASKISYDASHERWIVETESEFGTPVFGQSAPFVVTADLRLAEPRFPSLPNLVKARRKPIIETPLASVANDASILPSTLSQVASSKRRCKFIDPAALVHLLTGECL